MLNLAKRVNHWVWDPNEERKRLESWQQEQERLLQVHWWSDVEVNCSHGVWQGVVDAYLAVLSVFVCNRGIVNVQKSVRYCFYAGAIPKRTGKAEERVGKSTTRGGGGGEKTHRRSIFTHEQV